MAIEGVRLIPLVSHIDDRGSLFEVVHNYDLPPSEGQRFGQVYVVSSPVRGTIRGLHKHKRLWDYFCCVSGAAKIALTPEAQNPTISEWTGQPPLKNNWYRTNLLTETFILAAHTPQLLVVPPETWHGWMALEDNTTLLSIGTEVYDRERPDEVRIDAYAFGDVWSVRAR